MPYMNPIRAALAPFLAQQRSPTNDAWSERAAAFHLWDAYYTNAAYEATTNGGYRDAINAMLGAQRAQELAGLFNPVARVIDLYAHVLNGAFGRDIMIDPASTQTNLLPLLEQVWQWSNMSILQQLLCQWTPLHGTSGLRIVADSVRRRVYQKVEHASIIRDVELDPRGNVIDIELQYTDTRGIGDQQETVTIRERQTKQRIQQWRVERGGVLTLISDQPNTLGVVSYVLVPHIITATPFGFNAFFRVRTALDHLNSLITHLHLQIHDHLNAPMIIAGSGKAPDYFDLSGRTVMYVDTSSGATQPSINFAVSNLDLGATLEAIKHQISLIKDELPELKATEGEFLAGQSGETIAQLRQPAEDRLKRARVNYEDALVRSQQIALSWGILLGLWDVGTGMGTREAADAAYKRGLLNHRFADRPILPPITPEAGDARTSTAGSRPFKVGDRVRITVPPHMPGQSTGTIALVEGTAYGIIFDAMQSMGVHKWYTASELELITDAAPNTAAAPAMAGMEIEA